MYKLMRNFNSCTGACVEISSWNTLYQRTPYILFRFMSNHEIIYVLGVLLTPFFI